jgi:hypothetical protein
MRITIISFDNWGFNQHIEKCLLEKGNIVNHIDINSFKYKYPNLLYRVKNFIFKLFIKKNLKHVYYGEKIIQLLNNQEKQDLILTIKGDFIDNKSIIEFKNYTKKSIAFFNDAISRYPNIKNVLPFFDEVYSFEKKDCDKYNLKFKTNFIYQQNKENKEKHKYQLFNISSKDKRTKIILKIAAALQKIDIKYKIIIFDNRKKLSKSSGVEIIEKPIPLEKVNQFIDESKVLLDIHRTKQDGLSFRVFESLGNEKKLITTNQDIKSYNFYNPNNIFVIDLKNPTFPKSFFESPYQRINSEIFNKYLVENWVENFIS